MAKIDIPKRRAEAGLPGDPTPYSRQYEVPPPPRIVKRPRSPLVRHLQGISPSSAWHKRRRKRLDHIRDRRPGAQ